MRGELTIAASTSISIASRKVAKPMRSPVTEIKLQALALELVGGPMTRDNLRSMSVPNVCADGCELPFGLAPAALEQIAPGYLGALGRPSR